MLGASPNCKITSVYVLCMTLSCTPRPCRVGVLRKWRERFGPYATYRNLSKSFYDAGRLDLVEAVCNLIGGPLVKSQGVYNNSIAVMTTQDTLFQ